MFALRAVQDVKPPRRSLLPWMYGFRERSLGGEAELVTVSRAYLDDLEAVAHAAIRGPWGDAATDGTRRLRSLWNYE
jgi:hypothetical protein